MKYLVTGNIKRDGKPLKIGSVVEFDTEEGDPLMAGGFLSGPSAADRAVVEKADEEAAGAGKKVADKKVAK